VTVSTHLLYLHIMIFFLEISCTMKMKVRITSLGQEVFHFAVVSSFFNSFGCNDNACLGTPSLLEFRRSVYDMVY
jgi:hypothetical protein